VNLGVFLCVRCSDVHRAVGTHISKVKGCSGTYLWGPDEIARMQEIGNARAKDMYGSSADARPSPTATKEERVELCKQKYEQRRWAPAMASEEPATKVTKPQAVKQESLPKSRTLQPQPSNRGTTPWSKPADLLDFDDFFKSFDDPAVVAAPAAEPPPMVAALAPEISDLVITHNVKMEATQSVVPACKSAAQSIDWASMDAFLDQCLSQDCKHLTTQVQVALPEKAVAIGELQRMESPSLWANFGEW